jgi:pimeloyl-ACP methyl ester carboxylesterase
MGADQFWTHKNFQLHYYLEGSGPPFFLIHGYSLTLDWHVWDNTIPVLTPDHTVYAFDMVGHGQSTKVDPKPSAEIQAELLVNLIQEHDLTDCSLGGVSWGGTICQLVASSIPDRIKRLLLVSSAGYRLSQEVLTPTQKIPTLIIWSEDDAVIPLANGRELQQKLPHANFVVIPPVPGVSNTAAHHPQHNKAKLTNPHIQSFLTQTQ